MGMEESVPGDAMLLVLTRKGINNSIADVALHHTTPHPCISPHPNVTCSLRIQLRLQLTTVDYSIPRRRFMLHRTPSRGIESH